MIKKIESRVHEIHFWITQRYFPTLSNDKLQLLQFFKLRLLAFTLG